MKCELFNDHFQNWKSHLIQKAQLIIADIPYNVGKNAYGSNPAWYIDGDNANGQSDLAGTSFFDTDKDFRISEFLNFCTTLMVKEPKEPGKAPAMIVFCEFKQQFELIEKAKKHGLVLYRDKLPKFNNDGKMVFNCIDWEKDTVTPKIHPTQKPIKVLERLIKIFTDPVDVVIDPVAGSGTTLLAALNCGRNSYGFEIKKNFYRDAVALLDGRKTEIEEIEKFGLPITRMGKATPTLFTQFNTECCQ